MRRLSGIGLAAASCAAVVAAWRIGDASHSTSSAGGARVVSPAQVTTPTTSTGPTTGKAGGRTTPTSSSGSSAVRRTIDGAKVQTQYGVVQVQVVVTGRRLTDVSALHLTDSSPRSVSISAQAAPILRREALAAGSAHIDSVSGASYTSQGYIQSLQSALDAARAAA